MCQAQGTPSEGVTGLLKLLQGPASSALMNTATTEGCHFASWKSISLLALLSLSGVSESFLGHVVCPLFLSIPGYGISGWSQLCGIQECSIFVD